MQRMQEYFKRACFLPFIDYAVSCIEVLWKLAHSLDLISEIQEFRARNPVHQGMNFGVTNALKLTYEHLEVKKFFRGLRPLDPQGKGEGFGPPQD